MSPTEPVEAADVLRNLRISNCKMKRLECNGKKDAGERVLLMPERRPELIQKEADKGILGVGWDLYAGLERGKN